MSTISGAAALIQSPFPGANDSPKFNPFGKELIKSVENSARKHTCANVHYLELKQAGLIAIWHASLTFDPAHGVPFEHYARRSIVNAMLKELNASAEWSNQMVSGVGSNSETGDNEHNNQTISIDRLFDTNNIYNDGFIDETLSHCLDTEFRAFVLDERSPLTELQRQILAALYWEGLTVEQIAHRHDVSHQYISNQHRKALKTLKQAIEIHMH